MSGKPQIQQPEENSNFEAFEMHQGTWLLKEHDVSDQIANTLVPEARSGSGPGAETEIRKLSWAPLQLQERRAGLEHTWTQLRCLVGLVHQSPLVMFLNPAPRFPGLKWMAAYR